MSIKTTVIDLGADKLIAEAEKLKKQFVKVGIQAGAGSYKKKGGRGRTPKIVIIAATHEFGTRSAGIRKNVRIPQRSFIRSTVDGKKDNWERQARRSIDQITEGKETAKGLLVKVGMMMEADIKGTIKSNIPPPLKIRVGGTALWNTGQMLNHIRWVSSMGDEAPKR